MGVEYADSPMTWDDVLCLWQEQDTPGGWRLREVSIEQIFVAPPPDGAHNLIAGRVNRQLLPAVPDDSELFQPRVSAPFGHPVPLGAPFAVELDTTLC